MTAPDRWLLPDGVEDILPPLASHIESLRRSVVDLCRRWGYQLVIPPLIEYLESLHTGTGYDLDLQTFKLTDQLTGRMMGLRADITPQAARIDAHTLREEGVTRLCYAGHVLHTRPHHMLAGRTPIQAGCELFGSRSEAADLEVIHLMLAALKTAGLNHIHLDLSHVGIVQSLLGEAAYSPEKEAAVFDALGRKSLPELDRLLEGEAEGTPGRRLRELAAFSGGIEVLQALRSTLTNSDSSVAAAIEQLERVTDAINREHDDVTLGFDFCELRGYNYHTGLVFAAYVPGHGDAVGKGGRYDAIGADFGRPRPATGFSLDVRALAALSEIEPKSSGAIWAPAGDDPELESRITRLRQSETVIRELPGEKHADPRSRSCDRQLVLRDGAWTVQPLASA